MKETYSDKETKAEFLNSRSKKIILGAAIGDTLGMSIEGWTPELITKYLGKIDRPMGGPEVQQITLNNPNFDQSDFPKNKFLNRKLTAGEWTDDTMLMLSVAEGIINAKGFSLNSIAKSHIELYNQIKEMEQEEGWGAFGKTTLSAMENLEKGFDPKESGINAKGATGNGPALKTAPIGIYAYKNNLYEKGLIFAYDVGKMTHKNPASIASGVVQAHAVYSLLSGISQNEFLSSCIKISEKFEKYLGEDNEYLSPKLKFILENKNLSDIDMQKEIGNRFTVTQSYPFALFMFNKYWNNHIEGLINSVSMGGDADSVGAIYGALAGANGLEMPKKWLNLLKNKNKLINISQKLLQP